MIAAMALFLAAGDAVDAMAPIGFLVGHCWRGAPKAGQTDTHCFRRLPDGSVRDHSELTDGGKPVASGDAIYRWDAAARVLRFTYRDSLGGSLSSTARRSGDTIDFGTADYHTKDGKSYALAVRWTVLGASAYQTELSSPLVPFMKRKTRYDRVS